MTTRSKHTIGSWGLGSPTWPQGCNPDLGQRSPGVPADPTYWHGCVPTEWPEATPQEMVHVRCARPRQHAVHTQLPPGGESEQYHRFLDSWLRQHDCVRHVPVTGATGRDFCCRTGPGDSILATLVTAPAIGIAAVGALLAYFWLKNRREQSWLGTDEEYELSK